MTRILVCGGRDFGGRASLFAVLDSAHRAKPVTAIIHGAARGADTLAGEWAQANGVRVESYPANWSLGKKAGPMRNRRMLVKGKPDIVFAFPRADGSIGEGTADMMHQAKAAGVRGVQFSVQ